MRLPKANEEEALNGFPPRPQSRQHLRWKDLQSVYY